MYWEDIEGGAYRLSVGNLYEAFIAKNASPKSFRASVSCAGIKIKEWDDFSSDDIPYYRDECYNLIVDSCKDLVKFSMLDRRGY